MLEMGVGGTERGHSERREWERENKYMTLAEQIFYV